MSRRSFASDTPYKAPLQSWISHPDLVPPLPPSHYYTLSKLTRIVSKHSHMNNNSLPASPVRHSRSPPFDSPQFQAHNLHQNFYNSSQTHSGPNYNPHHMNPASAYGPNPSQPSFSMQPMPMSQHQRSISFSRGHLSYPQAPTGVFNPPPPPTVNPQLTFSPPIASSWHPQSYFASVASSNDQQIPTRPSRLAADNGFDDPAFIQLLENPPTDSQRRQQPPLPQLSESTSPELLSKEALLNHESSGTATVTVKKRSGPPSDSSNGPPPKRPRRNKKPPQKPKQEIDSDEEEEDDEDVTRAKYKACHHCRKQKSKCKKPAGGKCDSCRTRNLPCFVEQRPERKLPVSRKALQEELDMKNALIKIYRQILIGHPGLPPDLEDMSSGTPPSSDVLEEPLRKQVLEWLDKAGPSPPAVNFTTLDRRALNEPPSSSDDDEANLPSFDVDEHHHHDYTGGQQQQHNRSVRRSDARSISGLSGVSGVGQLELSDNHSTLSHSPRVPRNSRVSIRHPFDILVRAANAGASVNASMSQAGSSADGLSVPISPSSAPIGPARPDYFDLVDPLAKCSQIFSKIGVRRIEIDRGLSEEPKLLRKGLINPGEVDKLFAIFFEKLDPSINLLDQALYSPTTTFARCPLLFTVVCAVASRYYTERPELYSIAMHFAVNSASTSLMEGKKTVELCQAYLLLSMWPLPCRKYDEDRAWLYLGLAIRMAMDLNLHVPVNVEATNEAEEREILNRTRTWIICYNMDRSTSAQLGKPMTIRENYIIQNSEDWYRSSKYNTPYDIHLCQTTALMRIMADVQQTVYSDANTPSGIRENLDLRHTAFDFDEKIVAWEQRCAALFAAEDVSTDPGCRYRRHLLPFYANYSRLVVLSFGFQYSLSMGRLTRGDDLIKRCLDAAQNVIGMMVDDPAVRPYLRHAPDSHLVCASFASAFLLKLLRHKFVQLIEEEQRSPIIPLVERFIRVLSDSSVSIDDSHTPKIYARFLNSLLRKHRLHEAEAAHRHETGGGATGGVEQDRDLTMNDHESGLRINLDIFRQPTNTFPGVISPTIEVTPPSLGNEGYNDYPIDLGDMPGFDYDQFGDPVAYPGMMHLPNNMAREHDNGDAAFWQSHNSGLTEFLNNLGSYGV